MSILDGLSAAIVVLFTLICLVMDVRSGRLPNWLTVPMFALGLLVHTAANRWPGLQFSFFGFATGFGVLVVLWLFGGGGGGDVKMMTALGAWLGAVLTIEVFLASAVFTVIIMLGGVVYAAITKRHGPRARTKDSSGRREERSRPGRVLPYAVPLSLATWAVVAYTIWLRDGHLFESPY